VLSLPRRWGRQVYIWKIAAAALFEYERGPLLPSQGLSGSMAATLVADTAPIAALATASSASAEPALRRVVVLVRHGESEYNAAMRRKRTWVDPRFWFRGFDPGVRDAPLTERGEVQALALGRQIAAAQLVERLGVRICIVSPLSRALRTALLALRGHTVATEAMRQLPIVACALAREIAASTADVGRPVADLQQNFKEVDFSGLEDGWWRPPSVPAWRSDHPRTFASEPAVDWRGRVADFQSVLLARPEQGPILVVGHSKFFMGMTGETKLANCGALEIEIFGDGGDGIGVTQIPAEPIVPRDWMQGPPAGELCAATSLSGTCIRRKSEQKPLDG